MSQSLIVPAHGGRSAHEPGRRRRFQSWRNSPARRRARRTDRSNRENGGAPYVTMLHRAGWLWAFCAAIRARSTIACVSRPFGMVPKVRPQSPSSRVAQNASATEDVEYRTSRLAWSAKAIISTMRRATGSNSLSFPSLRSTSLVNESSRASAPRASRTSPRKAAIVSGSRCIERKTSRQMTLPVPSQIPLSGASIAP